MVDTPKHNPVWLFIANILTGLFMIFIFFPMFVLSKPVFWWDDKYNKCRLQYRIKFQKKADW